MVRGVRGATTVEHNEEMEILQATRELVDSMVVKNHIRTEDIVSVLITVSPQLNATFPARAVRDLKDWRYVPVMCALEIPVAGALENCIRILLQVNSNLSQKEIEHIYLNKAVTLRPDLKSR